MLKTEEKLKEEVGKLYSFANIMYPDAMSGMCQRKSKKPKGFEEERLLEHIEKGISKSVESYFKDFKIDEKLFKDFDDKRRKHLVGLIKSINEVEKDLAEDILEEFFSPHSKEEILDSEVEKVLTYKISLLDMNSKTKILSRWWRDF